MSITETLVSFAVLVGTVVIPSRPATKGVMTFALLLAAPFVLALATPEREFMSRVASGLRIGAITSLSWQTLVQLLTSKRTSEGPKKWMMIGIVSILVIVTLHNLSAFDTLTEFTTAETLLVNPWAFLKLMLVVAFCVFTGSNWNTHETLRLIQLVVIGACATLLLFQVVVLLGVLPGNTLKAIDDLGGTGLGNISTNETAFLGIGLMVWCLRFLQQPSGWNRTATWIAMLSALTAVLMTKSRLGIAAASLVLVASLLAGKGRTAFRLAVFGPVAIAGVVMAGQIIQQRSIAEVSYWQGNLSISEGWGSGRGVFWSEYWDAFSGLASNSLLIDLFGVGPVGILQLYDLTRLNELGVTLQDIAFYPTHSDLLTILLTCGTIGLLAWLIVVINLIRLRFNKDLQITAYCAIGAFVAVSSGDMLSYVPEIAALLVSVAASCIGIRVTISNAPSGTAAVKAGTASPWALRQKSRIHAR